MEKKEILNKWLNIFKDYKFTDYNNLSDIQLYLDQFISYVGYEINFLKLNLSDQLLTQHMINNYIKSGVIKPTIKKKYNKNHICDIKKLLILKQVLNIDDLRYLISNNDDLKEEEFKKFNKLLLKSNNEAANEVIDTLNDNNILDKALELSIKAFSYITIAKKIIHTNNVCNRITDKNK